MPPDLSSQDKYRGTSRTVTKEYLPDTVILPNHLYVNRDRLLRIHLMYPEDNPNILLSADACWWAGNLLC